MRLHTTHGHLHLLETSCPTGRRHDLEHFADTAVNIFTPLHELCVLVLQDDDVQSSCLPFKLHQTFAELSYGDKAVTLGQNVEKRAHVANADIQELHVLLHAR